MGQLAETKGLTFQVDVEEYLIHTDTRRLKRVMGNLVFNAVQHTFEGGVYFSYRRHGGVHRFTVKDSGPGISEDLISDKANSNSSFGSDLPKTGIGLYVVKRLCQEMDWNLSMCNVQEGGTVFVLELYCFYCLDCSLSAAAVHWPGALRPVFSSPRNNSLAANGCFRLSICT